MSTEIDTAQRCVVIDFNMPFWRMVWFTVKLAIASIPAMIILLLMAAIAFGVFQAVNERTARREVQRSFAPAESPTDVDGTIREIKLNVASGSYGLAQYKAEQALALPSLSPADRVLIENLRDQANARKRR